jgi:hypothetical protein
MAARSKLDKASAVAVVCAILTAGALRAHAQSLNPPTSKPTLIVWAHTNLENQGAPTLDVLDLERYLVNALAERKIENVVAWTTVASHPPTNAYLLELSVDAMQVAERPRWNENSERYAPDTLFGTDLSLRVKEFASGKVLGVLRSRAEHHFDPPSNTDDMVQKRAAIYESANKLADQFVTAASDGHLGQALERIQPSLISLVRLWHVAAVLGGLLVVIVVIGLASAASDSGREAARRKRVRPTQPSSVVSPSVSSLSQEDRAQLKKAVALYLATENFSDEARIRTAKQELDAILDRREAIEEAEAERRLCWKDREANYKRIATSADESPDFGTAELIKILRKADEWAFRVLQVAIDLKKGGWKPCDSKAEEATR